jgi:AcrR family transcriptional regulator
VATRGRLLEAAEDLFGARGYEATSMAEIAERAGVAVGTLCHHFPDKRALLLALIDDWGERALEASRDASRYERYLGPDPRRAIHDDLLRRYTELEREGGLYLLLLQLADRDGEVRQRLRWIERFRRERLRDLVAEGQQRGVYRDDIDPMAAAFLIRNAVNMAATELNVHEHTDLIPESILKELADMICRYILDDSA